MSNQNQSLRGSRRSLPDSIYQVRWFFCLIVLPFAILLPSINKYPFPQATSQYSDILVSHFPNIHYLIQSLFHWKTIPLWSSAILSGYPFAANPLSGLWYFPYWVAVILPMPFAINLLVILHLIGGGIGVYQMLRGEQFSEIAALFGGLAFELMPKLYGHYGGGHVGLIIAVCWTPWLLVSSQYALLGIEKITLSRHFDKRIIFPALILSAIIMADIRWIGFAILLWVSYLIFGGLIETPAGESALYTRNRKLACKIKSLFISIITPLLMAIGLTAPFLFPFLEFVQLSTRRFLTSADNLAFSLPPAKLLGLIFPAYGDYFEWVVYPGILVIILALLSWGIKKNRKIFTYWTVVLILSIIYALGSNIPGSSWWASLPVVSLLRVPSRILFISGFCIICLSAGSLQGLIEGISQRSVRRSKLLMTAMASFVVLINAGAYWITGEFTKSLIGGLLFGSAGFFVIWMLIQGNRRKVWVVSLFCLCVVDLIVMDLSLFLPRNSQNVFSEGKEIAEFLTKDTELFRIYSPSYSLEQHIAAVYDLELADGVDPLQLASYEEFMEKASGVITDGYSVTLPPFATGNPKTDNQTARPNLQLLGLLNVKYIIADFDISVAGLEYINLFNKTRVYKNNLWLPRAWIQSLDSPIGHDITPVQNIIWSPNHITVSVASGIKDQMLVISEIYYPGWQVFIDGKRRQIDQFGGLFRSVVLEPGDKVVTFIFRPMSLCVGLVFFLITIIFIAGIVYYYGHRSEQERI